MQRKSVLAELDLIDLYRALMLPRTIETKMLRLIRQNKISKWFSGYGQEAIAVGCTLALSETDYVLPTHRNLGVWTTRGVPLYELFCQLMGKDGGYTNGRDRTFHFGLPEKKIVGMISHMAAMLPVACGLGLAAELDESSGLALAFCGEGASREGDFHEALNLAAAWKLPVIFVVENNGYGLSTPTSDAMAVVDLADAAKGYGMPGKIVDGNNLLDVIEAVERAARRARFGEGPTLLEMKTFRMRGHEEASGTKYVPQDLMDEWAEKDPVLHFRNWVLQNGKDESELEAVEAQLVADVDEAAEFALEQPLVESDLALETAAVYAPATAQPVASNGKANEMRFIDAISDGLRLSMRELPKTVLLGQDIAEYGGVFKVTNDFVEEFGGERVRNTPIIESGILGAGMGLAIEGFSPIVEIQYADFITCGFHQVVHNLATTHYRWGQPLPVTIRAPFGGGIGAGPFHSESIEAWFCHVPGLKVVVPSSPADAKGLLASSILDPNPVLFFEHKFLYRSVKGMVPEGLYTVPLGTADVARQGDALTIVTYGVGVHWAIEAAADLSESGIEIEVVDLRTLIPWDRDTVFESIGKTNKAIVLHEASRTAGFGGELAAEISEHLFGTLDAPVMRVCGLDTPIPFSINLEQEIYSAKGRLSATINEVLNF